MNKYQIFELFNQWGFHNSDNSSPIELFAVMVIIFSNIALWCYIDILILGGIIYILNNKLLLEKASKYKLLLKIINFNKNRKII